MKSKYRSTLSFVLIFLYGSLQVLVYKILSDILYLGFASSASIYILYPCTIISGFASSPSIHILRLQCFFYPKASTAPHFLRCISIFLLLLL
ncbi:hypothetical protein B0H19DRAFT_703943 [Mycena capillaripes]|nr:hypothetical protein B0H19DRAFT_703943 [Mycena capillaripes]